jgi:hypothetical protein
MARAARAVAMAKKRVMVTAITRAMATAKRVMGI